METVEIDFSKLSGIYPLLEKNHECAGTLVIKGQCVEKFTMSAGESDSVQTPLSRLNWHTHPLFLYIREDVCWGWPSGEDMREVIFFSLGGNKAHLVFSAEGVYILSVTDCFRNWLKTIKDPWKRGLIISLLEMVFKSTHNLRTIEYNKLYPLTPNDWIKMVEKMRLSYLFKRTQGSDPCGKITCSKITTHQSGDKKNTAMLLQDYADNYEGDSLTIYKVAKNGSISGTKEVAMKDALEQLGELSETLGKTCAKESNAKIYNIKFFKNSGLPNDLFQLSPEKRKQIYKTDGGEIKPPKNKANI